MLTKKDFEFCAKFVRNHSGDNQMAGWRMARDFVNWIEGRKPVNDKFNRDRFMREALPKGPARFGTAADQESDCRAEISKAEISRAKALLKRWREANAGWND